MSDADFTESPVEEAVLGWLESIGRQIGDGSDITPDTTGAERANYGNVVLTPRVRKSLARVNPDLLLTKLISGGILLRKSEPAVEVVICPAFP